MVHIGDSHIFGTIYIGGVIDTKGGWEWLVAFYWPKCTRKLRLCFRVDSLQPFRVQLFWGRCHCDELIQQLTQEDSSWFAEDDIFSFFFFLGGYIYIFFQCQHVICLGIYSIYINTIYDYICSHCLQQFNRLTWKITLDFLAYHQCKIFPEGSGE